MAASGLPGEADAPPRLVVAVDDLGTGLWSGKIKQELGARVPLRNVLFSLSRAVVSVEELPIRYLDARADAHLAGLRKHSHSPVAWFRSPLVQVVLSSCGDYEEYRRDLRLRLKAMADTESAAPASPELLFVYVRPPSADAAAKGPARVFDAMRKDLNRRRERCVRLDPVPVGASVEPGAPVLLGLEDFDRQLKDALRAAFEARTAAYAEEVRRLMLNRLDPSWTFSILYLVKDGLAAMLEAAGLLEDALREYSELEACYLETLQSGQQPQQPFGSKAAGEDEAALMWASWATARQAATHPDTPPEWVMRQALFASQARLLLKLHRHTEVAERGLAFVRSFGALLAQQQHEGSLPPQLRDAWSFAGYLSLAAATSRLQAARAEEKRKADGLGRAGGRRARLSEVAIHAPGSPVSGADALPVPIPLSPASLGITSLQVRIAGGSADAEGPGSPEKPRESEQHPQLDWQLGVLPSWGPAAVAASSGESGPGGRAAPGRDGSLGSSSLYCLLGKLYCGAREELLRLGAAAGLDLPKSAAAAGLAEPHQHVAPPHQPAAAAAAAVPPPSVSPSLPPEGGTPRPQAAAALPGAHEAELAAGMQEAPSASDLAQVDLGGPVSSSEQQLDAEQAGGLTPASSDHSAAQLKLVSAPDGEAEASAGGGGVGSAGVTPRQVAPAPLQQRLSLRAKAFGDADSASSSPRSTSTQQSSLQPAFSDVHSDIGHAVAPAAAAAAVMQPTSLTGLNDMRSAERQVASVLADRSTRSAAAQGGAAAMPPPAAAEAAAGADADAAALPPWLVHWRLRAALSSQQLFTELYIELSEAAARCYSQCSFLRTAAVLRAEVADALAKAGSMLRAAELYERQCRTFLREGWHALAAATLPKLAACQLATGSTGLAHTAAALLSLPTPFRGTAAERQAACQLLLQAAQLPGGPAGSSPLLPTSPLSAGSGVNLSAVLAAAPLQASVSRFFGRTCPDGAPLLSPPPHTGSGAGASGGAGNRRGALSAAVGDALAVQVVVRNQLSVALPLHDVVLTLAVLQEMTVIHSPRASPRPSLPGQCGGPATGSQRRASLPATPLGDAAGMYSLTSQDSLRPERFETQWQQVEELACSLVSVRAGDGITSGSSGSSTGGTTVDGSSSQQLEGSSSRLQPLRGAVLLPPGSSVLTFLAAPVHRGLYKAVHLRACLQQLALHVAVEAPAQLWDRHQEGPQGTAAAAAARSRSGLSMQAHRRSSIAGVPAGSPLMPAAGGAPLTPLAVRASEAPAGVRAAEAILLCVKQAQPRVQLALVAAGGSLVAGQEQWLGLLLAPERDSLHDARLELTWPLTHASAGLAALPPISRKSTGLGLHRAVQSVGGDIRLSPAGSAGPLPAPPPFIRPEHRSAVLLQHSGSCQQEGHQQEQQAQQAPPPQLLPAEGTSSQGASWLLSEGLMQQLLLPPVEEGRPVSLWWRVTAGEVPVPPEQVHIAPPAPRHSSRPHDSRRLAGLPGEGPAPPAVVLDVPVSLEYASGCQRSHCRMLTAPVRQPFTLSSVARELPSRDVALQCTLTSNLAVPAQIAKLALEPQPGFAVSTCLLDSMGLLPTSLPPGASLAAAFLLAPEEAAASGGTPGDPTQQLLPAKLQPSSLTVEYSVDSRQQCGVPAAPLGQQQQQQQQPYHHQHGRGGGGSGGSGPAGGGTAAADATAGGDSPCPQQQQQQQTPGPELLDLLGRGGSPSASRSLSLGEGSPTAVAEGSGEEAAGPAATSGGLQLCSFRHLLTLERPALEDAETGTLVYVRLLGPFSATVGQPTTLCWRLERGGQPDQQQPAARISLEVQAESDHWRPLGRRVGGVTLAGHAGAVATVEATWVPLAAGTLPVPALRLQDVSFQEVFDVGLSGGSAITVAEAVTG